MLGGDIDPLRQSEGQAAPFLQQDGRGILWIFPGEEAGGLQRHIGCAHMKGLKVQTNVCVGGVGLGNAGGLDTANHGYPAWNEGVTVYHHWMVDDRFKGIAGTTGSDGLHQPHRN